VEKYKYITIVDSDESLIIPKLNSNQTILDLVETIRTINNFNSFKKIETVFNHKCDRFSSNSNSKYNNSKNNQENYLNYLNEKNDLNHSVSYNFNQANYMKQEIMQLFFLKFEQILLQNDETYPFEININNLDQLDYMQYSSRDSNGLEAFEYVFEIKNESDFNYAYNLYNINRFYLKPFLNRSEWILNKTCDRYKRFFILYDYTQSIMGKSIHNTQTTFTATLHEPYATEFIRIPFSQGYMAHFRANYHFKKEKNQKTSSVPIKNLIFDLNYFQCYFKPIVRYFKYDFFNINPIQKN